MVSSPCLSDCRARGYDVCRTRQGLLGKCCCPIGYKVVGRKCLPCTGTVERVNAWHKLPLVYVLHPETGRFAFSLMCLWSLVLLPLPWPILAQKMWRHLLLREAQQDHVRHYLVHHQRPRMAETWWTRHRQHRQGPMAVWVSSMSGQTKELSGFFPHLAPGAPAARRGGRLRSALRRLLSGDAPRSAAAGDGFQEPQRSWHRTWKPAMPRSLQGTPAPAQFLGVGRLVLLWTHGEGGL